MCVCVCIYIYILPGKIKISAFYAQSVTSVFCSIVRKDVIIDYLVCVNVNISVRCDVRSDSAGII